MRLQQPARARASRHGNYIHQTKGTPPTSSVMYYERVLKKEERKGGHLSQGTMPHSNILLAMGPAILFRKCSRILGSLRSIITTFCFICAWSADWAVFGASFLAFKSAQLVVWYLSMTR